MEAGSIGQLTTMRVMDRPTLTLDIIIWIITRPHIPLNNAPQINTTHRHTH